MCESNFWETTTLPINFQPSPLPDHVDFAIVGAGFSGLSAALTLAKTGASVVVLEAETAGWGASSRNGGMVLTGMKLGVETLIQKYGRERARQMFSLSLDSINLVEKIVGKEEIDCSFSRCGHFEAAWKPAHFVGYARAAELMEKEFGHKVQIVSRADQTQEIGSDLYYGGMVDDVSAGINPAKFVQGLASAAVKRGAVLHEGTRVLSISAQKAEFSIQTNRGDLTAGKVFVGTSGYSGAAVQYLQKRIAPIGSYIIATSRLPDRTAQELIPKNRMIFDSKHILYYFRLTPDQRLLFGGRAIFREETLNSIRESEPILRRSMIEVFPQLKNVDVEFVWGGSLDFAMDSMPHAGSINGINYSLGYAGHGVAIATQLGNLVARQMLGEKVENPLDGIQFNSYPFNPGHPWYLPMAGVYYQFLDLIS